MAARGELSSARHVFVLWWSQLFMQSVSMRSRQWKPNRMIMTTGAMVVLYGAEPNPEGKRRFWYN